MCRSYGKLYYAVLSGEHPTLPLAELKALLDCLASDYAISAVYDLVAVFEARGLRSPEALVRSSGMVSEVGHLLAVSEASLEAFRAEVSKLSLASLTKELGVAPPFAIKRRRVKGHSATINAEGFVEVLAKAVSEKLGWAVDLDEPSTVFRLIFTDGVVLLGLLIADKSLRRLHERRPRRRPFFKPGALAPNISRVFVNLSRPCKAVKLYLDPFCGTAGFVIEAGLARGVESVCLDVEARTVEGALRNIKHYGVDGLAHVVQADATRLPLREGLRASVGTDLPYGRSSSIEQGGGGTLPDLAESFLRGLASVLKRGCYVSYACPAGYGLHELAERVGFKSVELHYMKVHRSLTRVIHVVVKDGR